MNELMEARKAETITAEDVKKYFCANATDKEIFMFLNICKTVRLNPFLREIYLVKYQDDKPAQILTGYETYLKRADRSGNYAGMKTWTTGSVENNDLVGHVEVYRKGWDKPLEHEVDFAEYAQYKTDYKTKKKVLTRFWAEKPKTMIKKVAVSQAFRMAFPDEFSGMPYTQDEINDVPEHVELPKAEEEKGVKDIPRETPLPLINEKEKGVLLDMIAVKGMTEKQLASRVKKLGYDNWEELNTWDYKMVIEELKLKVDI